MMQLKKARHVDAPYPGAVKVISVPETVSDVLVDEVSAETPAITENKE